jgi:hypothetical protein
MLSIGAGDRAHQGGEGPKGKLPRRCKRLLQARPGLRRL